MTGRRLKMAGVACAGGIATLAACSLIEVGEGIWPADGSVDGNAVTSDGSTDAGPDARPPAAPYDSLPTGAISFFSTSVCPTGWAPYEAGEGRTIVPVPPGAGVGATVGTPLASGEDRTHTHPFKGSVALGQTSFVAVGGVGTSNVGAEAGAGFVLLTKPGSSNLPYVQLLVCQKMAAPHAGTTPIPSGTLLFFAGTCPASWSEVVANEGRLLVGLPDGGQAGATFGGPPLVSTENRPHVHRVDASVIVPPYGVTLINGCCASGYATAGTYPVTGTTGDAATSFPYLQLVQCAKE
jgi:hypothetical protein